MESPPSSSFLANEVNKQQSNKLSNNVKQTEFFLKNQQHGIFLPAKWKYWNQLNEIATRSKITQNSTWLSPVPHNQFRREIKSPSLQLWFHTFPKGEQTKSQASLSRERVPWFIVYCWSQFIMELWSIWKATIYGGWAALTWLHHPLIGSRATQARVYLCAACD